jgi:membrane-bound lytic murein transglycosylase A
VFLEDVVFQISQRGERTVAVGDKLNIYNKITNQNFSFDNKAYMGSRGVCRASLGHLMEDYQDDGMINGSDKDDQCIQKRIEFNGGNGVQLKEFSFNDLEEWHGDDFKDAMIAFMSNCSKFANAGDVKSESIYLGKNVDWLELCRIGYEYQKAGFSKGFFERYFSPFKIIDGYKGNDQGLFTGYYIWELPVSLVKTGEYVYPIYAMPPECRKGSCYSRMQINSGALNVRGLEIAWAKNAMDVYFMQVQGSGIGVLPDGRSVRFNFAGKNNMQFRSFMEFIKQNKGFAPYEKYADVSDWLYQNNQKAIIATNISDSYVFFSIKEEADGVIGSFGVLLTQSRSIAIDPKYIPYGAPVWIETYAPVLDKDIKDRNVFIHFNRLYIAQDTGSAIKGAIRADLYMGHGGKGEWLAKNMKFPGKAYMFLPNFLLGG